MRKYKVPEVNIMQSSQSVVTSSVVENKLITSVKLPKTNIDKFLGDSSNFLEFF